MWWYHYVRLTGAVQLVLNLVLQLDGVCVRQLVRLLVLRIVLIGARLNDSARGSEVCIGAVRRRNVEQRWDTLRIG